MSALSFTKLFKSILDSTLWVQHANHIKVTWITMMAMADADGFVAASIPGLAKRAGVTVAECEEALAIFLAPDKYSRTPDHEGRRIREIKGGWELLNYVKHRKAMAEDVTRENRREYMRTYRAERSQDVAPDSLQNPERAESANVTSLSSSSSKSDLSDPDPEQPPSQPEPGMLKPSKRELADVPVGQPVLRHKFRESWKPKRRHRVRGEELGLTEDEILARADDCRLKVHKQGFDNEDDHFMRELSWEARDKQTRKFKEQAYANRRDFEQPGHDRG